MDVTQAHTACVRWGLGGFFSLRWGSKHGVLLPQISVVQHFLCRHGKKVWTMSET